MQISRFLNARFAVLVVLVLATLAMGVDGFLNEDREPIWPLFWAFGVAGSWRSYQKWRRLS